MGSGFVSLVSRTAIKGVRDKVINRDVTVVGNCSTVLELHTKCKRSSRVELLEAEKASCSPINSIL